MEFKNLSEAIRYIEKSIASSMPEIGEDMMDIMKEAIQTDIYDDHTPNIYQRTDDLKNTPTVVTHGKDGITVEYSDNGNWYSVLDGGHFFPLIGYEMGKVWAEGGGYYEAQPLETAYKECDEKIPDELADLLRALGIPVEDM